MDRSALNDYIQLYYDSWYKYTKYLCNYCCVKEEPYDIFMNTIVALLEKKEIELMSLIECEQHGNRKLLYYTKVMIKNSVFKIYNKHNRSIMYSYDDICFYSNHSKFAYEIIEDKDITDVDNEKRIAESKLRDDSMMTPFETKRISGNLDMITWGVYLRVVPPVANKDGSVGCVVNYVAEARQKIEHKTVIRRRYFKNKAAATQWALQYKQNTISNRV